MRDHMFRNEKRNSWKLTGTSQRHPNLVPSAYCLVPSLFVRSLRLLFFFGAVCAAWSCGGCSGDPATGYTTNRMFPDTVHSVAVNMFTRNKDVYRRDVEIRLTEAVVKRVQQNTPYKIATRERADSDSRASWCRSPSRCSPTTATRGSRTRSRRCSPSTSFWKDRHGNVLAKVDHLIVSGTYIPEGPFNENFFAGSEDIINKIARLVVEHMESDW